MPAEPNSQSQDNLIWAVLLHLSYNMWSDRDAPDWGTDYISAKPYLRFDENLWANLLHKAAQGGLNMVLIDLGDGIRYQSHPEIAVQGAWSVERLKQELARMRQIGLEPIPKLNFSTAHDTWMGPYARMVSTDAYYGVCRDLIAEVIDLFDRPRFFHLGMDEETAEHQRHYAYMLVRQYDLWWHDLHFSIDQVERGGSRAWVWSDYIWHHPETFLAEMPRSVLQSNWYYGTRFDDEVVAARAYRDLEAHGFDQVPTGSNWSDPANFRLTAEYCREHIAPSRLKGLMQTVWKPTLEECRERHWQALDLVEQTRAKWRTEG